MSNENRPVPPNFYLKTGGSVLLGDVLRDSEKMGVGLATERIYRYVGKSDGLETYVFYNWVDAPSKWAFFDKNEARLDKRDQFFRVIGTYEECLQAFVEARLGVYN